MSEAAKGERIAKVIARAGICSRRDAERLIEQGRVSLDGAVLTSAAVNVGPESRIAVDGEALPAAEPARLWRYHKPLGVVTSTTDARGRPTIYDGLPATLPRVMPVGRLDLNSEGLLLLTNDGGLKRRLELPATGWTRRYRVRVYGRFDEALLAGLAKGVRVEGLDYGPIVARLDSRRGANAWLTMSLKEGKNREIRKVCAHLGLQVSRLLRVAYGPFQLGQLAVGEVEEVTAKVLREQLGDAPKAQKSGTARPKPKPRARPGGKPKPGPKTPAGRLRSDHANRRRKA